MRIAALFAAVAIALLATPSCRAQESAYQKYLPLYADNSRAPLDVQREGTGAFQGGRWGKFSYAGKDGERVPALIYIPSTATKAHPAPCLILLHGLGGNKEMMTPIAQFMAGAGYASLMIDEAGQGARKAGDPDIYPAFANEQDMVSTLVADGIDTVVDLRRGIDYLDTRPDIDKSKIGVIGFSLGALEGTILAGVDDRVKAVALVSGGGDLGKILTTQAADGQSLGGHYASLLSGTNAGELEERLAPVEPLTFVGHIAPRPLLMEHGKKDAVIPPADAQALYDAAGQPKQIVWFPDSGHIPPPLEIYPSLSLFLSKYLPA